MPKPSDPNKWSHMFTDDIKFAQKVIIKHPTNNTFLVLKRSSESKTHPNYWDFAGGNVLFGESAKESVLKEIEEETGLLVDKNLIPLVVDGEMKEDKGIYRIFIGYTTKALSFEVLISDEHSEFNWVSKEEFNKLQTVDILKTMVEKL